MSFYVGIDLGTSNTVVSVFENGILKPLKIFNEQSILPSIVLKYQISSSTLAGFKPPKSKYGHDAVNNDEWKRMGKYYLKAYQIKERNPEYFKKVYNKLLKESYSIIQKRNDDPMQALCLLHTGWCMWESYLISTGDYSTARGYQGTTYKFTPRIWSNPLAFDTGQYCGATKNAVLLWISPEDYDIEIVR